MIWFIFASVYLVLFQSSTPAIGQSTVSSCAFSASGSEESLLESLAEHDHRLETMNKNVYSVLENFQVMNQQMSSVLGLPNGSVVGAWKEHDQRLQTLNDTFASAIDKINEKLNAILDRVNEGLQYAGYRDYCRGTSVVCDCSDIKANGYTTSGVYSIYVVDQGQRYYANAYCDMTTANSSWTVFQRRKDGSVDFSRGWRDYANGFGSPNGEFWLGNEFLYRLTSSGSYRLRIDLEDYENQTRFAEYSTFNISSSADKYRLRIGHYSGTAGNSLMTNNGHRFSTKDTENNEVPPNCSEAYGGAWWYSYDCGYSNLNSGRYSGLSGSSNVGMAWHGWHGFRYSMKRTEMKISSLSV